MLTSRRRLSVAALAAMILAATGSALTAQESNTVGPPQLKDFQLPGRRTTPPPVVQPQPQPQSQPVQQGTPQTRPPAARQSTRTAVPDRTAPDRTAAQRTRPIEAAPAPAPTIARPPAATAAPPVAEPSPVAPQPAPPRALPAAAPAADQSGPVWPWLGGAALLALLGWFGLRRFSGARAEAARRAQQEKRAAARAALAAAKAPIPAAPVGPRARLELGFIPDRAVATDSETAVHYDLLIRNTGALPARNIRIDARMFNASAQADVGAFLNGPIHEQSGSPLVIIAPGGELKLASSIAMPKEEVKGINVKGLSIFVPIVAINVAYDWADDGAGRTSLSWLVGREPETPSDKMGAFRLDLGPRIYRSVGGRPTELANVA
jgi:hypothetical protein